MWSDALGLFVDVLTIVVVVTAIVVYLRLRFDETPFVTREDTDYAGQVNKELAKVPRPAPQGHVEDDGSQDRQLDPQAKPATKVTKEVGREGQ